MFEMFKRENSLRAVGERFDAMMTETRDLWQERHRVQIEALGDYRVVELSSAEQPYSCLRCGCMVSALAAELHRGSC